jgi:hypothetical protein
MDAIARMPPTESLRRGTYRASVAVIDPASRKKIGDIPLKGHPESFQLTADGSQGFVNIPDTHEVAVVNIAQARQTAS